MIVKQPLPEDPTPYDAPPSYDALTDVPGPSVSVQDYKGPLIDRSTPIASSSRSAPPLSPSSSTSFSLKSPTSPSADNKAKVVQLTGLASLPQPKLAQHASPKHCHWARPRPGAGVYLQFTSEHRDPPKLL
ncbi:hypothetical protein CPB84DRAFT_1854449 [Gymnopilus junonius]|uniref:Uncharacterized protein n=1 Tax=Gymnopilus junonius TaxID=109634 RepID=A0A9P5N7N1_GYMJU|nr:hypothetical protein CPB84DRAFT_1854449 [Gymnopilus junonius]